MSANVFDIVIIISLLGNAIAGFLTGFIVQAARVFSLIAAFWAAGRFADPLASRLSFIEPASWRAFAAAVIIFFAVLLLAGIASRILKQILVFSHAGWLDKALGAAAAFLVGLIIWALIILVLENLFPNAEFTRSSRLIPYFNDVIDIARQWLPPNLGGLGA